MLEGGGVVGGGLAVGAEPRRAIAGRLGVLEHRRAVTRGLGMMREPRGLAASGERDQRRPMQADAPVGRELVLDRRARDLVAERDRVALGAQHPGRQARLELRQFVARDGARAARSPRAAARPPPPPAAAGPGRAGAPRGRARRRARWTACAAATRQHLGHEERVAAGARMQPGAVDAVRRGQPRHGRRRQRPDRDPVRRTKVAEHDAQRVIALQLVVAIGRDHQRRHRRHAAAEQLHQIERRLVGPVQILQHDDRRTAQRTPQRHEHLTGGCPTLGQLGQLAADLGRDVEQRPERPRREQRLTAPGEHRHRRVPLAEGAHQRGLPGARLPGQQHQLPSTTGPHLRQPRVEHRQLVLALQQIHRVKPYDYRRRVGVEGQQLLGRTGGQPASEWKDHRAWQAPSTWHTQGCKAGDESSPTSWPDPSSSRTPAREEHVRAFIGASFFVLSVIYIIQTAREIAAMVNADR